LLLYLPPEKGETAENRGSQRLARMVLPNDEDVPDVNAIWNGEYADWKGAGADVEAGRGRGWLGFEWVALIAPGGGQSHWKKGHPLVEFFLNVCGVSAVYSADLKVWNGKGPLARVAAISEDFFSQVALQSNEEERVRRKGEQPLKKKVVVTGYSTGGMLLSLLWSRCKEQRARHLDAESMLLLMGTQFKFTSEVVKKYVWDFWTVEYQRKDPKRLAFLRGQHGSDDVWEAVVTGCRRWFDDGSEIFMGDDELKELFGASSRAFLVTGEFDSTMYDSTFFMTGELQHVCPAARVLVMPGFSHFDYFTKGTTNWQSTMLAFHYFLTLYTAAGQRRIMELNFVSRL